MRRARQCRRSARGASARRGRGDARANAALVAADSAARTASRRSTRGARCNRSWTVSRGASGVRWATSSTANIMPLPAAAQRRHTIGGAAGSAPPSSPLKQQTSPASNTHIAFSASYTTLPSYILPASIQAQQPKHCRQTTASKSPRPVSGLPCHHLRTSLPQDSASCAGDTLSPATHTQTQAYAPARLWKLRWAHKESSD